MSHCLRLQLNSSESVNCSPLGVVLDTGFQATDVVLCQCLQGLVTWEILPTSTWFFEESVTRKSWYFFQTRGKHTQWRWACLFCPPTSKSNEKVSCSSQSTIQPHNIPSPFELKASVRKGLRWGNTTASEWGGEIKGYHQQLKVFKRRAGLQTNEMASFFCESSKEMNDHQQKKRLDAHEGEQSGSIADFNEKIRSQIYLWLVWAITIEAPSLRAKPWVCLLMPQWSVIMSDILT